MDIKRVDIGIHRPIVRTFAENPQPFIKIDVLNTKEYSEETSGYELKIPLSLGGEVGEEELRLVGKKITEALNYEPEQEMAEND